MNPGPPAPSATASEDPHPAAAKRAREVIAPLAHAIMHVMQDGWDGVRRATAADAPALGTMLHTFNREFGSETPGAEALGARLAELLASPAPEPAGHGTAALIAGGGPDGSDGFAILRLRPSLYSEHREAYLAELYVAPVRRGQGLGRALLTAALELARELGADRIELGTSETDRAARALYESMGFTNTEDGPEGPIMYAYEREL